jgi:hypothetical protein
VTRKGKTKLVNPDDLSPGIAAGLTQGASKEEALEQFKPKTVLSGAELVRHMGQVETVGGGRVPLPRFVASEDDDSLWLDEPTGRIQKNVNVTFQPETVRAIQSGMICLRCYEPQGTAFPEICESHEWSGCAYPIRERQIMDFAMEFEGGKHLGPAKPITQYLEEQRERVERRRFDAGMLSGKSPLRGLH